MALLDYSQKTDLGVYPLDEHLWRWMHAFRCSCLPFVEGMSPTLCTTFFAFRKESFKRQQNFARRTIAGNKQTALKNEQTLIWGLQALVITHLLLRTP